ncbi:hypothetical protein ACNF49_34185 [Actinomadura sp. ATCC 39365]
MDAPQDRLGVVDGVRLMLVNVSTVISTAMSPAIVAASVPAAERHLVYAAGPARLSGVAGVLGDGCERVGGGDVAGGEGGGNWSSMLRRV